MRQPAHEPCANGARQGGVRLSEGPPRPFRSRRRARKPDGDAAARRPCQRSARMTIRRAGVTTSRSRRLAGTVTMIVFRPIVTVSRRAPTARGSPFCGCAGSRGYADARRVCGWSPRPGRSAVRRRWPRSEDGTNQAGRQREPAGARVVERLGLLRGTWRWGDPAKAPANWLSSPWESCRSLGMTQSDRGKRLHPECRRCCRRRRCDTRPGRASLAP